MSVSVAQDMPEALSVMLRLVCSMNSLALALRYAKRVTAQIELNQLVLKCLLDVIFPLKLHELPSRQFVVGPMVMNTTCQKTKLLKKTHHLRNLEVKQSNRSHRKEKDQCPEKSQTFHIQFLNGHHMKISYQVLKL